MTAGSASQISSRTQARSRTSTARPSATSASRTTSHERAPLRPPAPLAARHEGDPGAPRGPAPPERGPVPPRVRTHRPRHLARGAGRPPGLHRARDRLHRGSPALALPAEPRRQPRRALPLTARGRARRHGARQPAVLPPPGGVVVRHVAPRPPHAPQRALHRRRPELRRPAGAWRHAADVLDRRSPRGVRPGRAAEHDAAFCGQAGRGLARRRALRPATARPPPGALPPLPPRSRDGVRAPLQAGLHGDGAPRRRLDGPPPPLPAALDPADVLRLSRAAPLHGSHRAPLDRADRRRPPEQPIHLARPLVPFVCDFHRTLHREHHLFPDVPVVDLPRLSRVLCEEGVTSPPLRGWGSLLREVRGGA